MKTALVIMAAGIGSRFGGGIKQLAPVGMNGEIIMDYSIHDAIEAGFDKIVFIIRRDIEEAFREAIGSRIEKICEKLGVEIAYAYQEREALPEGVSCPKDRTKPWGTGQAVLACRKVLHEPFAVINADDYYGKEAFVKVHDFLTQYSAEKPNAYCMAGFILKNTLSENGAVTRGICETNENGYLTAVHETSGIVKTAEEGSQCGAHTFPYMDIHNETAVVEHEATTSKISEDQLFYCNQRGIPTEDAIGLIVNGYAKEVLNKLPMEFAVEAQKLLAISLEGSVG